MTSRAFDFGVYVLERTRLTNGGLDRFTPSAVTPPAELHAAIRYSLLGGGKRIRPLLCMAAAEAVGGHAEQVLPMACALEMIHTFSLIHDDLPALDNDDYRRGQPTSHRQFGESMAILAGDALHTLAFATIADHQRAADPSAVLRAIAVLAEAAGTAGMVGGQVDDIASEGKPVTIEALRSIHERKTGALLNAALLSGALLCEASPAQEAALRGYGDKIGLAFQIVDDILDVVGDDETLGKPTGSDEKNEKATYPRLFGLQRSSELARDAADAALSALAHFDEKADPLRAFARFIIERNV